MTQSTDFHRPELLAPGGDLQSLQVAVRNGADAVYFGLDRFSARSQARNLSLDQLPEALRFLHEHSARGYLALNTLLRNDELPAAVELSAKAYSLGIDAVIVQDVGLASILHREFPELALHGSTQLSLFSEPDLAVARDLGLRRLVLPRELSGDELERLTLLANQRQIETEAFIHGALCICYSGQCLMSSLIGGRSGNRGACAQPCRLDYRLDNQDGALYSPHDQSLLAQLPAIARTQLTSLKIEGRMRSAAYVGQVVAVYRKALDQLETLHESGKSDDAIEQIWPDIIRSPFERLRQAFNRGGSFSSAYWQGQQFDKLIVQGLPGSHGVPIGQITRLDPYSGALWVAGPVALNPGDVLAVRRSQETSAEKPIASAPVGTCQMESQGTRIKGFHPDVLRELLVGDSIYRMTDSAAEHLVLQADQRKTSIGMTLSEKSLTATVHAGIFDGRSMSIDFIPDPQCSPLRSERAEQQLRKSGGTAYVVDQVRVANEVRLTIGQLNQYRREVLVKLGDLLQGQRKTSLISTQDLAATSQPTPQRILQLQPSLPEIAAYLYQIPQDESDILCGADLYELPLLALDDARIRSISDLIRAAQPEARIVVHWPPLVTGSKSSILPELIAQASSWPIDGVCTSWPFYWDRAPGQSSDREDRIRIADTTANLFNTTSLLVAQTAGANTICPSLELNGEQLRDVLANLKPSTEPLVIERPLYGWLRLMSTAYCPVGKNMPNCRKCVRSTAPDDSRTYQLIDRKNQRFPVLPHPRTCQADLLNSDLLAVPEEYVMLRSALPGNTIWRSRLLFSDETAAERRRLVSMSRELINAQPAAENTAVEALLNEVRAIAGRLNCRITSGHFQRGVQ